MRARVDHPSGCQAACRAIQPESRDRLDRANWPYFWTVTVIVNISSRKLITLIGGFLVSLGPSMLYKRHVSDTCDVLQAEVHMVSIRHIMNLKRQIIENFNVPRRVKHLTNSLSRVYLFYPSIWKTLKFGREMIIWSSYTGHSNIWGKSGSVVRRCFFPEHLILNFFKFKVDLLELTLKLILPPNYFQILRQKYSKSYYLENIKVRRL